MAHRTFGSSLKTGGPPCNQFVGLKALSLIGVTYVWKKGCPPPPLLQSFHGRGGGVVQWDDRYVEKGVAPHAILA